ncbi:MAG TPA: hypothetical protein VF432_05850 [Thermoanaerobaculia bacterium]
MRLPFAVFALLFAAGAAADPVYLDQLMETPLAALQQQFPGLRKEGCYRVAAERYVLIDIQKKEGKPWRVALTDAPPCKRPEDLAAALDVRHRKGVELGHRTVDVLRVMGRPDASAAPEPSLKRLGDTEYFYICRVSEGCARHTSIFVRDGLVSAISDWYSD